MAATGFWDNQEKAQQTVQQLKGINAIVKPAVGFEIRLD